MCSKTAKHPQLSFGPPRFICAESLLCLQSQVAERLRREWRLEQMVVKMDTREAIKCLDAYSDSLISLSLLVGTSTLRNDSDLEMKGTRTGLQLMLLEKQKEAMELALAIVTAQNVRHRESIFDLSFFEMNEAVQRYVLAH